MAVLLETSKGDIVIDLHVDECPNTCRNFLKLCKMKYYNNCIFHNVQRNFIAQTGDPTGSGKGGDSVYGLMYGEQARFFDDELVPRLKHSRLGSVGMASAGPGLNASQFYLTLSDSLHSLDERRTLFGSVSEGREVLEALNEVPVDAEGRPLQNIRIRHTIILDDPFDDPPQLAELIPDASPPPTFEHGDRLEEDWAPVEDERPPEEVEKASRAAEAANRAVVLEMIGDLPEADAKPPSNMLFVCKLNPVTSEEDLEIIFGRFGTVTSCDIIRDFRTGESLCYGFVGFDTDAACEAAYFKMNNVLIDDRRIKVDFSQSVSHIWRQFKSAGKRGGDASLAVDAAQHGGGGGGGRGRGGGGGGGHSTGPAGGRGHHHVGGPLILGGPRQRNNDNGGLLLDDPAVVEQQERGRQPPAERRHGGQKESRYASRSRSRSRGRRRRSSSRDGQKQHKHDKGGSAKHAKHAKHRSRSRSRGRHHEHRREHGRSRSPDSRRHQQSSGRSSASHREDRQRSRSRSRERRRHDGR